MSATLILNANANLGGLARRCPEVARAETRPGEFGASHKTPPPVLEAVQYLRHHLALAGRQEPLLADDAIARLHQHSNGLPRSLNNLAHDALEDTCAKTAVAEQTAHELGVALPLRAG